MGKLKELITIKHTSLRNERTREKEKIIRQTAGKGSVNRFFSIVHVPPRGGEN